jgi:hypothetical protein
MTSSTGTVPGVTNVTGRSDKGRMAGSRPRPRFCGNGQRTNASAQCGCPRAWGSARASSVGCPIGRIVCTRSRVTRRGLRAQVRKKIRAYPVLPHSVACLAFKKNHRPTRSFTGSTWRADQARAAIGTRIASSSFTRRRHLVTPKSDICFSHTVRAGCVN